MRRNIIFNKVAISKLKACRFKNETPVQVISCEFHEIFKNPYLVDHLERLLLDQHNVTSENYYQLSEISVLLTRD